MEARGWACWPAKALASEWTSRARAAAEVEPAEILGAATMATVTSGSVRETPVSGATAAAHARTISGSSWSWLLGWEVIISGNSRVRSGRAGVGHAGNKLGPSASSG